MIFKKTSSIVVLTLALSLGGAFVAHAEETAKPSETPTTIQTKEQTMPPAEKKMQRPPIQTMELRKDMRADMKEVRADMRAEVKEIRTDTRANIKEIRTDGKAHMKLTQASSSDMFKRDTKILREDMKKKMEVRQFEVRKQALVKELTMSLANLTNITTRIETRISKTESEGRDMTEAKSQLAIAKQKIDAAKVQVAALTNITVGSTTTTSTDEVELTKPRQVGDAAIKSVKDARESLQKVVTLITHSVSKEDKKSNDSTPVNAN